MVLDTREEELGWRNKRREREIEWKEKGGKGLQLKGKSERGELHAERKIKKERKKGGKDRKTCTHTHTHLRIEFIRVNSAAGTRREREREGASNRYRRAGICSAAGYNEKITAFAAIICTRAHVHRRRCGVCERERTRGGGRGTCVQPRS